MKLVVLLFVTASVVASATSKDTKDVAVPSRKQIGIVYLIPIFHPRYYEGTKYGELGNDIDAELPGKAFPIHSFALAIPTRKQLSDIEPEEPTPRRVFHSRHRRAANSRRNGGGFGGGGGGGGGGGRGLSESGCQSSSSSSSSSFSSGGGSGREGGGGFGGGGGAS